MKPYSVDLRERVLADCDAGLGTLAVAVVFIDETWAKTNMCRRYGRSRRGDRLVAKAPHGDWKTTTFIAA